MKAQSLCLLLPVGVLSLLVGCGTGPLTTAATTTAKSHSLRGAIHGGQQPVTGAIIQLYTVGTGGDASLAQPLLTKSVMTDENGFFQITNDYDCDNATQVYLTATGGNPGLAAPNPNLVMVAALGPCSALSASTYIWVNELTTVAAAYALAPYATSATTIGSGTSDAAALAGAFTLANEYVNTTTGQAPGTGIPSGYSDPTTLLNTLADIMSACVNTTGGVAGDNSTLCGTLFGLTPSTAGTAPTDTFSSMLNLAKNPGTKTAAIFNLSPASAPFQPALTQPPADFNVRITPTGGGTFLAIEPGTTLAFEDEPVNGPIEYANLELVNDHTTDVTITGFNIVGPNASDFAPLLYSCNPGTVLGFDVNDLTCVLNISATPSGLGERLAYLQIFSTAPDSPYYVKLYLSGTNVLTTAQYIYRSTGSIEVYSASPSKGYGGLGGGGGDVIYGALRVDYVGNLYSFSQINSDTGPFVITTAPVSTGIIPDVLQMFTPTAPDGYSFNGGGDTLSALSDFAVDNQGQVYIPIQTSDAVPQIGIAVYPPNSTGVTPPSFVIPGYGKKVAVGPQGFLYALDPSNNINNFPGEIVPGVTPFGGDALTDQLGTGAGARVLDMATDGNGDVISLIYGTNGYAVVAYSTDSYGRSVLHKNFYGSICQLNTPTSLAADGAGNIYVNDVDPTTQNPVILVFNNNGGDNYLTPPSAVVTTLLPPTIGKGIAVR